MFARATTMFLLALALPACGEKAESDDSISVQNSAAATVAPGRPAPAEERGQDFVAAALGAYAFESESARIAAAGAERPDVKQFAQAARASFESSGTNLKNIATAAGLNPVPTTGATHQSDLAILSSTKGAPLEMAYLEQKMVSLTDLLGLVRAYKNGGDNPQLKAWAETAQAMIADQLDKTQTLRAVVLASAGN